MMKFVQLKRKVETDQGIIGRMGEFYTLENKWKDNRANISCIPDGYYIAYRSYYNRGGYGCFEVANVPGRTGILIHIGNTQKDTSGCILLGQYVGVMGVSIGVGHSKRAHDQFMASMEGVKEFHLEITDDFL